MARCNLRRLLCLPTAAVLPALLLLSSNPTNVYFRHNASAARSQSHGGFYHPLGKAVYEYFIKSIVFCCTLEDIV